MSETKDPFQLQMAEQERWMDANRPRLKFPFECSITGCKFRADSRHDVTYHSALKHFCSREHMLRPWEVKQDVKKVGRPKGAKNRYFKSE